MTEAYQPPSAFLQDLIAEKLPLGGSGSGKANLHSLIALTRDPDRANRDWATLLLAQLDLDTADVRQALVAAAADVDPYVRGEAILGIAQRDRAAALPFLHAALQAEAVCLQVFEAAAMVADPSLIGGLRDFTAGEEYIDQLARAALAACEGAAPKT